jgi:hypothetical protein
MTKIVYNNCYGGFGISELGMLRYAEIKGIRLYPEKCKYGTVTYWVCPLEERTGILSESDFYKASLNDRQISSQRYNSLVINPTEISRTDPIFAQVVEELGNAASGPYAELKIQELTEGTKYRIDEYDGRESVVTRDEEEWSVA